MLPGRTGPDFGWTATGKTLESALRPAEGRPEDRFRCFPGRSPAKIRPGRPISGPEALLRNVEHFRLLDNASGPPGRAFGASLGPALAVKLL